MFRKGIVTFFDDRSGLGYIELAADHQRVIFNLENFSNTSILPQIGERVKCIVIEERGEFLAKFIVRLDHKNYVADKNKPLSSQHAYDESSFENIRNSRKILKKRRISTDSIALQSEHVPENITTDQIIAFTEEENESVNDKNVFATQSTKTIQTQIVAIQPQIIKSNLYTEAFVEAFKPIQIEEGQSLVDEVSVVDINEQAPNEQIPEPVEMVQEVEIPESIQPIQIEAVQSVVDEVSVVDINEQASNEQISEPVEMAQEEVPTESIQPIQVEEVQSIVDEVSVVNINEQASNEQILEPVEVVQEVEIPESIQPIQIEAGQSVVDEVPVVDINEQVLNEQISEPVEMAQEVEIPESIQPIQVEAVQSVVKDTQVTEISEPALKEQIFEPIETIQEEVLVESVPPIQVEATQSLVDNTEISELALKEEMVEPVMVQDVEIAESIQPIQVKAAQTTEDTPVVDALSSIQNKPESKVNDVERQKRLLERQLLEKNMDLSAFQKFIQRMKVKFLYSKRKQTQVKPEVQKRLHFNPWILVAGVVLLGGINFSFYAHDRYAEYKSENLLKLQQYEHAQKEEIKRQKQEATSR